MVVGRLLSYWEGNFSGAMLNFGGYTGIRSTLLETNFQSERSDHDVFFGKSYLPKVTLSINHKSSLNEHFRSSMLQGQSAGSFFFARIFSGACLSCQPFKFETMNWTFTFRYRHTLAHTKIEILRLLTCENNKN